MSILKEIPPTAGFPLYLKDFLPAFFRNNLPGSLEEDFKEYLRVPYAEITYSGTSALYLTLEALKEVSAKKTVIIPSFICPLVPLAIHRAGLRVIVCDINKDNFDFDLSQLKALCSQNNDILAIIAVHLGGIPLDFENIKQISANEKIFVIEDCAQSLGAEYKGRKTGTLGDLSFFSLCRGKGLTIYEGGAIVSNKETYCQNINSAITRLVKDDFLSESLKIFELFGYWFIYRPWLFWWAFGLPQAFWYWRKAPLRALTEYFTEDFPIHRVSNIRKSIGHAAFPRLDAETEKQRQKASAYIKILSGLPGIKIITELPGTKASYPYLTLLFDNPAKRNKTLEMFRNSGLGVFQIYAAAITDYDYLKPIVGDKECPNARCIAQNHISLTTSAFLKDRDLNSVVEIIRG